MKDYNLIQYIIRESGQMKQKDKTLLCLDVPFGRGCTYTAYIYFSKRQSIRVDFDLEEVYETYGREFGSVRELTTMLANTYAFLRFDEKEEDEVYCLLYEDPLEHVASQALARITFMTHILNKTFGTDFEVIYEEDWRNVHRKYLAKQQKNSHLASIGSAVGFVLSIALLIYGGSISNAYLLLLAVLAVPASLIAAIVFLIRKWFYKRELARSKANTR
ncbi:MAG: hypothetical protein ACI4U2_04575 [Christensenellaceae bacterium]